MHTRSHALRAASVFAVTVSACGAISMEPAVAQDNTATWYVEAGAAPGGVGSMDAPFGSLAAVSAAAGADDTILVLPAAANVPPLDGGIVLKPGQAHRWWPRGAGQCARCRPAAPDQYHHRRKR